MGRNGWRPRCAGFRWRVNREKARKGILITISTFSQQAKNYAAGIDNLKIILIDSEQLAQLMINHDIAVTEESRYIVKKIDLDYFGDE
jgi:restriction system protein